MPPYEPYPDEIPLARSLKVDVPPELAPRTTNYTLAPPTPPHIHIPAIPDSRRFELPTYAGVGGEDLTGEDLKTITQVPHVAFDQTPRWRYEWRREAQVILPFLYLGPSMAAKDRNFLRNEAITMLLVIRDLQSARALLLNGEKVAKELGIQSATVDVAGPQELIAAFPKVIKIINEHLLSIYRQQIVINPDTTRVGDDAQERAELDQESFQRGKVLLFCESGNERSACAVSAYIMAMYGMNLVSAIQFVQSQRFCIALDDDMKAILWSFQDILQAHRDVGKSYNSNKTQVPAVNNTISFIHPRQPGKRHIEETVDEEMEIDGSGQDDRERFEGRESFAPFSDSPAV